LGFGLLFVSGFFLGPEKSDEQAKQIRELQRDLDDVKTNLNKVEDEIKRIEHDQASAIAAIQSHLGQLDHGAREGSRKTISQRK
jgi:septal ring factor EnvC (AmiA/AmiB activator)